MVSPPPINARLLFQHFHQQKDQIIVISGRVKTNRTSPKIGFLEINDGTTLTNVQIVLKASILKNFSLISKVSYGSFITVTGTVVETPHREQLFEIKATAVKIISEPENNFLIQKKYHTNKFLRTIPHLRTHTYFIGVINRIKSFVISQIINFFHENDFYQIITPVITSNSCEGGSDIFSINNESQQQKEKFFFPNTPFLTTSSQMYAEAMAQSMTKVFTFGPTFRAELSKTSRHLAEFWMIEAEMINHDLTQNMDLIENLINYIIKKYLVMFESEIIFLEKITQVKVKEHLLKTTKTKYQRIEYLALIKILQEHKTQFQNQEIHQNMKLDLEHEKFIASYFQKPCFIFNFPKKQKAFYMKTNQKNNQLVNACDLVTASTGEIVGGSERETNYQQIVTNCQNKKINLEPIQWYLNLRKYGYAPSSGFGIGFERLIMHLTGVKNIREIISFPVAYQEKVF